MSAEEDNPPDPTRWERTRDFAKKHGKAAAAGTAGLAVGAAAGAGHRARDYVAAGDERIGTEFIMFVAFAMMLFIWDYSYQFIRGTAFWSVLFPLWVLYAFFMYLYVRNRPSLINDSPGSFTLKKLGLGVFLPYLLVMLPDWVPHAQGYPQTAYLVMIIGSKWFAPILMFTAGYPYWTLSTAGKMPYAGVLFRFIKFVFFTILILALLLPVSDIAQRLGGGGGTGINDLPTMKDMVVDSWTLVNEWINRTSDLVNGRIEEVTQPYYTGQVEAQQGRPLGVRIAEVQATQPTFYYSREEPTEEGAKPEVVLGVNNQVTWAGQIRARTLSDDPERPMKVNIYCEYYHDVEGVDNISLEAQPRQVSVFYSGDMDDVFDFWCSVPMGSEAGGAGIPYSTREGRSGTFYTRANFTFRTWGYTTLTFMDRDFGLALRRQGQEPCNYLGINCLGKAVYTPGPISLGMEAPRQPLLITTDSADASSNYLPAFSVTLDNAWRAQYGKVTRVHELVMQVPEPLELKNDCFGVSEPVLEEHRGPSVYMDEDGDEAQIPEGYTWYVLRDIDFPMNQNFKTIRCPMVVGTGDWSDLLSLDREGKQFTLVARVKYDYDLRASVNTRLGVMG